MGPALAAGLAEAWLSTSSGWVPVLFPTEEGPLWVPGLAECTCLLAKTLLAPQEVMHLMSCHQPPGDESCPLAQAGEILKDWALTSQQFSLKESPLNWKGFRVFGW